MPTFKLALAGLVIFTLTDRSGQDARFFGRRGDHEVLAGGRTAAALELYQQAYRVALLAANKELQYKLLNNIGACQVTLFRYREAEQTLLQVRKMAGAAQDYQAIASVDANLAAVYGQMDDRPAAEMYARESLEFYTRAGKPEKRAQASITLADTLSRVHMNREGEQYFRQGIDAALRSRDLAVASAGWLHYGSCLARENRIEDADAAFRNSYTLLRQSGKRNSEDALLWQLSKLRIQQHDLDSALVLINSAISASLPAGGRIPQWRLYQTRAEVELAQGNATAALADARKALQWARLLRANVVRDNDDRVGMEGVLDETFGILIEAGNRVYLRTRDGNLVRETFEATEENRAQSLEALIPTPSDWRSKLSTPEYRYKLSQLMAVQRVALKLGSATARAKIAELQIELSQMESEAGAPLELQTGTVLARMQRNLSAGSAFLSFRLGERGSWLWTMENGKMQLYPLPRKALIEARILEFEKSIRENDTQRIATVGRRLYRDLFGRASSSLAESSQWFISLDPSMYTLELPALVVGTYRNGPVYLNQRKTLLVLPGAKLFSAPERRGFDGRRFVVAGDGIYNHADPRYGKFALIQPAAWSMARLPGSAGEIRFAAGLWRNASLLTGSRMTKSRLLSEIDRDPDVIHIASHVIEGPDRWHAGILALGIDPTGEPELLTSKEIELHPIHSRLVVMTGCESGSGEALPGSGLMGLTRAWLAAGAGEVLATRRASVDENGDGLIGRFYQHLLESPTGDIPQALRQARRDMIAAGGWRAEPRYWSSFFLIGVR